MSVVPANTQALLKLFDDWDTDFDTMCAAFKNAFAPDCIWANSGMPVVTGFDEAYEKILLPSHTSALAMEAIRVDTLHITESDNIVYSERIDHVLRADGSMAISITIAGITEFDANGLITHWRDYCDTTTLDAISHGHEASAAH